MVYPRSSAFICVFILCLIGCAQVPLQTTPTDKPPRVDAALEKFADGKWDASRTIQRRIDAIVVYSGVPTGRLAMGGVVELPPGTFKLEKPLRLPGLVTVKGRDGQQENTLLRHVGPEAEAALVLVSPYTHGSNVGSRVTDLVIWSERGRGIALDPTSLTGAAEEVVIERVRFATARDAIDLVPPPGRDPVYLLSLAQLRFNGYGGSAIRTRAMLTHVEDVKLNNVSSAIATDRPAFDFDGTGSIVNCWFEPWTVNAATSVRFRSGPWNVSASWFESHAEGVPHVVLEGALVAADHLFFFHRDAKLKLIRSKLSCALGIEHRNDPAAIEADATSSITVRGEVIKAATQPTSAGK